jgi:hypothetical protein
MCAQSSGDPPAQPQPGRREGRGEERVCWDEEGALPVVVFDGCEARWGRALDLGRGGIGLIVPCPFPPRTPLLLRLRYRGGWLAVERWAEVIYARPHGTGVWWRVGCAFSKPLRPEEIQALV